MNALQENKTVSKIMILIKKILIRSFVFSALFAILIVIMWNWMFIVTWIKPGFQFEQYTTAESAKAALLKKHPIGSSVDAFIATLESAGAKVERISNERVKKIWGDDKSFVGAIGYRYRQSGLLFVYKWGGACRFDENRQITSFGMSRRWK